MAVLDLDQYLAQRYRNLVITPSRGLRARTQQISNLPPQTRGFPHGQELDQLFQQQAIEQQVEGDDGLLNTLVVKPFWAVLEALSAGEYAVASAVRSVIRNAKYGTNENPFESFMRGIADLQW